MMGSKKELAYKQINENFEEFLEKGIFLQDQEPSLYVYRIAHGGTTQTGIWATTSIDDYLNNTVKKHELTRADREAGLIEYLQQAGIDANPVLITYPPSDSINEVIMFTTSKDADLNFTVNEHTHWLWRISEPVLLAKLIRCFAELPASYIADGHHRAAAACSAGIERRKVNLKHIGDEEYNFFSSVYMATDQLKILAFNRLVTDLGCLQPEEFFKRIGENFDLSESTDIVIPKEIHHFGMYVANRWFRLVAKSHTYSSSNPVDRLDVSVLQQYVLSPVLQIHDPRTDPRISFSGSVMPVESLMEQVDDRTYMVAFTLFPTSIDELIQVADAGEVMPPKSTWFEPKFLAGLVIHLIS